MIFFRERREPDFFRRERVFLEKSYIGVVYGGGVYFLGVVEISVIVERMCKETTGEGCTEDGGVFLSGC